MAKPSTAQLKVLRRIAEAEKNDSAVYIYRIPSAGPRNGITESTLTALLRNGWVKVGDYEPLCGKRLILTDAGRACLPATEGTRP